MRIRYTRNCPPYAIKRSIDGEVCVDLKPSGAAFFLFTGNPIDFIRSALRHLHKVLKVQLIGCIRQIFLCERTDLEIFLVILQEVASRLTDLCFDETLLDISRIS